jgi:hypothetical protein
VTPLANGVHALPSHVLLLVAANSVSFVLHVLHVLHVLGIRATAV